MVQAKVKYWDIVWFHRWFALTMFGIVLTVVLIGSNLQEKIYKVDAEIYITPKPSAITGEAGNVTDYDYRLLNNQIEILNSDTVANKAVQRIQAQLGKAYPISKGAIQGRIAMQKKDYTSVISLSLTSPGKPRDLQVMMNEYLAAYQDTLQEINASKSREEREFLQKQLEESKGQMTEMAEKLRAFGDATRTYNIDTQVNQMLTVASRLDEQTKTANAEIAAINRQISASRKHLAATPEYINLLARIERDPEANDLRKKIVSTESERAEWSSKLTDSHPKMLTYDRELTRLRNLLDKRLKAFAGGFAQKALDSDKLTTSSTLDFALAGDVINSQIKLESMQARTNTLESAEEEVMGMLKGIPKQALEFTTLKNSFEMAQDKVKVLQRRLDEAVLMEKVSSDFTRVEVLKEPNLPGAPIRPDTTKNMTAAMMLGLCLALFSIFIRATLDRTLRWPFQVKGLIGEDTAEEKTVFTLPALASRQSFAVMLEKTNFTVPEPYKRLIIHLENLSKADNVRRIGIVPVSPFAECAMTTAALSLYLTELSNKMVLIDTDYSKHSLSRLFGALRLPVSVAIQEGPGLSDYLGGRTEDFVDIIYPLGKTVYGSLIPAGAPLSDGFQFSHRNLGQLEEQLSPNYNFVLYSLSSIEQSYDAIAVGRTLDGILLLVHPGVTGIDQIQSAIRELQSVGCRILGILIQPLK